MHLVLELLILRVEPEADKISLGGIQHGDLELARADSLAIQPSLHLQISRDLLLDVNLDRLHQWIVSRCSWCLLHSSSLRNRWLRRNAHAAKHIRILLLSQCHALLWSTRLERGRSRVLYATCPRSGASHFHATATHATTTHATHAAHATATHAAASHGTSAVATTASTHSWHAVRSHARERVASKSWSYRILGCQSTLLRQFHLLLLGHLTSLIHLALLYHHVQPLLVTVHLSVGLDLRKSHALTVTKGDDLIKSKNYVEGVLYDVLLRHLDLTAILDYLGEQPQRLQVL
mmetsp:Transcript_67212/g.118831  ORF Transcript_67212/g.118831 Transcript_67212/m.118831 type:complete len:291 (-) Transcript_67212:312-1184(-)